MIRIQDLRVDYGDFTAVQDLSVEIPRGEIFGLIGPNGAGKTSTMRVLAGLLQPTYGEVIIGGHDVAEDPRAVHRLLAFMPDWAPVQPDLKVWEFLELFAAAYGLPPNQRRIAVDEAVHLADLTTKVHARAGDLSRGQTQRLVLAKTLLPDPEVLILDEPASGLDPRARIGLRKLLRKLAFAGRTVMISSHILKELQGFCTSLGIMEQGRLLTSGRLKDILAEVRSDRTLVVSVLREAERAREVLEHSPSVQKIVTRESGDLEVSFTGDDEDMAALLARLVKAGIPVRSYSEDEFGVEEVFLQIGGKDVP